MGGGEGRTKNKMVTQCLRGVKGSDGGQCWARVFSSVHGFHIMNDEWEY